MPIISDVEPRTLVELPRVCETFHNLVMMAGAAGSHYADLPNA